MTSSRHLKKTAMAWQQKREHGTKWRQRRRQKACAPHEGICLYPNNIKPIKDANEDHFHWRTENMLLDQPESYIKNPGERQSYFEVEWLLMEMERRKSVWEIPCGPKSPSFYQIIPAKVTAYLPIAKANGCCKTSPYFSSLQHLPLLTTPSSLNCSLSLVSGKPHYVLSFLHPLWLLILSSFLSSSALSYNLLLP